MAVPWSLDSLPEIADLSEPERRRVVSECEYAPHRHWQTWLGLAAFVASAGGAGLLAGRLPLPAAIATCGVGGGVGALLFWLLHLAALRPYLRAARSRMPGGAGGSAVVR